MLQDRAAELTLATRLTKAISINRGKKAEENMLTFLPLMHRQGIDCSGLIVSFLKISICPGQPLEPIYFGSGAWQFCPACLGYKPNIDLYLSTIFDRHNLDHIFDYRTVFPKELQELHQTDFGAARPWGTCVRPLKIVVLSSVHVSDEQCPTRASRKPPMPNRTKPP
jgi:hypothetical protein